MAVLCALPELCVPRGRPCALEARASPISAALPRRSAPPPRARAVNRRMDEWVGIERFDLGAQETSGGDGKKVTRNIKRKFDESHHAEEEGGLDPVTLR